MPLKTKRNGYMKVLAHGRRGRPIYDELVDALGAVPTMFEQAYPFEWAVGPDSEVPVQPPSTLEDDEFVALTAPLEDEIPADEPLPTPPTDEELVDFWAGMVADKPQPKPKRAANGRFVKRDA